MKYLLILLFLTSCQTVVELKDLPIYHEATLNGQVFCYAEVKFVSGSTRCVPKDEYLSTIKPTSIILNAEGFYYFRDLALRMCSYANKSQKMQCSHDVKSFEDAVEVLWNVSKSLGGG